MESRCFLHCPLSPLHSVCCVYLSSLFLSLSDSLFPFLSISCLGMAGGVSNFSGNCTHRRNTRGDLGILAPALDPQSEERRELSRFLPALTEYSIYFFSLLPLRSFLSLCLRCTTPDEVVTLTHTHVIWDSRTRVPQPLFVAPPQIIRVVSVLRICPLLVAGASELRVATH